MLETVLILIHQCLLFKLSRLDFTNGFAVYWIYGRGELCTLNSYCSSSHRAQTEDSRYTYLLQKEPKKGPISWFRIRLSTNFERIAKFMTFHPAVAKTGNWLVSDFCCFRIKSYENTPLLCYTSILSSISSLFQSDSWTPAVAGPTPNLFISCLPLPESLAAPSKLCAVVLWGSSNWDT